MKLPIVNSVIHLMENGQVVHTIKIDDIEDYEFIVDTKDLSKMSITVPKIHMRDLDILVSKPYEHYVIMGTKIMEDRSFAIPAKVYCHMNILSTKEKVVIYFSEEKRNEE